MLNRYHILESLGKGSFGQVVRARELHTDEEVAIKIIKNKPAFHMQAQIEIKLLEFLRDREADTKYCIGERDATVVRLDSERLGFKMRAFPLGKHSRDSLKQAFA